MPFPSTNPVGLKVWSINFEYQNSIRRIIENQCCDFIELYAVPDTFHSSLDFWKQFPIPYIIHAPTTQHNLNPALSGNEALNRKLFQESRDFYHELQANYLIVHPGMGGDITATIKFLKSIAFDGLLVENKPYRSLDDRTCIGFSPVQIGRIMQECGTGFCLDFGHAIKSAVSLGQSYWRLLEEFNQLDPQVYHLADGRTDTEMDEHLNLGHGDYTIPELVSLIKPGAYLTLETSKSEEDFYEEYRYESDGIRHLMRGSRNQ